MDVPAKKDLRVFGLGVGAALLLFGALALYSGRHPGLAAPLLAAGVLLVLLGAAAPGALSPAYGPWMAFARALGWFNTRLLLTLVFFLVFTPVGLLMRLFGSDPMERRFGPGTYWRKPPPHSLGPRHFERQF